MAFKCYLPNCTPFHEGKMTWEEEMEFYRRIGGGPVTVLKAPRTEVPKAQPPKQEEPPRS